MKARDRKEASARLGVALQAKYRKMLEAVSNDEIQIAAIDLGECFNTNIEFICWVLKEYGGVKQMPFQPLLAPSKKPVELPKMPDILAETVPPLDCTCPVLEAGIIGRDKHMTACPQFQP